MSIQSNFPSLKPTLLLDFANTKQLDNRITFTRSTPAVYYDGKTTAMAEQNLLLWSQAFDNSPWGAQGVTYTSSSTSPDGTSTATAFTEEANFGTHRIFQSTSFVFGLTYTVSFYAKYVARQYLQLNASSVNSGCRVIFDIQNGAVTDASTSIATSVTSVGSGWYRCSATFVCNTASNSLSTPIGGNASSTGNGEVYTGSGSLAFYLWGAQVEQRASATAYTATTTQPITNYIPVLLTAGGNQARFDCNPTTGESLGLLIEEQRTNVATYSADLGNGSAWPQAGLVAISNANVAPDGSLSATRLVAGTSSGDHDLYRLFALSSTPYTLSVYAKYSGAHLALSAGISNPWAGCIFDLQNGVAKTPQGNGVTCTANIQSVGNGWYRCSITFTADSAYGWYSIISTTNNVNATMSAYGFISYAGDGWSGIQIWGAQLEAGSFTSSYIATTSGSTTRTADSAVMTGANFSSWFNTDQGTFYADYNVKQTGFVANINGPSVNVNNIDFVARPSSGTAFEVYSSGSLVVGIGVGVFAGKLSASYQTNNFAISINGGTASTDTSGNVANSLTQMSIGSRFDNQYWSNGTFKKIAYYPIAVTQTNLQALTS